MDPNAENETLIPTSEKVDTILTIVSTLVEDQKDGPTAEKLRFTPFSPVQPVARANINKVTFRLLNIFLLLTEGCSCY
jgi:hypothetical protein